jgi:hypothetical protein
MQGDTNAAFICTEDVKDMTKTEEAITSNLRKIYQHFTIECDMKQHYKKSLCDDLSLQD